MMKNFWMKLEKPFFALAPMAGYTDQPFRLMCKKYGADVLYSEMVSSEAIWHNKLKVESEKCKIKVSLRDNLYKTLKLIQFSRFEQLFVVQIFGSNPEHMALSAEYIATGEWYEDYLQLITSNLQQATKEKKLKVDNRKLNVTSIPAGIDVNMGCPVHDVTKLGSGAALLKNPKLASVIIKSIKKKVKNIPISVKTRLGWDNPKEILTFARMLEYCGADAIAIHGRTYRQGFSGEVDWEMIEKVKKQVKIPVIGNGDLGKLKIESEKCKIKVSLRDIINNKLDGYMIGTGALGRPWVFEKLKIESEKCKIKVSLRDDYNFIKQNILEHARLNQEIKGERSVVEFRKHIAWYLKGLPNISNLRAKLVRIESYNELENYLKY